MKKYYAPDLKAQIVLSYLGGKTISELANENKVSRSTIYIWIKEAQENEDIKNTPINLRSHHDLKVRCRRLETIIKILKTAPCSPSAPLQEKLAAIQEMCNEYNVNILCESLDVAKGTYYNHIKRNKRENTLQAQKKKRPDAHHRRNLSRQQPNIWRCEGSCGAQRSWISHRPEHRSKDHAGKWMVQCSWRS